MLGQLLDQIREYYLSRFMKAVDTARRDASVRVITEAALVDTHGVPIPEGALGLPLRNDLVIVTDGRASDSQLIDTEGMLSFERLTFTWEGSLKVSLSPFQWNWLELRLHGLPRNPSWSPLQSWFQSAFGDSQQAGDGSAFLGVAHFMSDPVLKRGLMGSTATVAIDLGSAPVTTLESLLDAAVQLGVTRAELGQFSAA